MRSLATSLTIAMLVSACEATEGPDRPTTPAPSLQPTPPPADAAPVDAMRPDVPACVESEHRLFAAAGHPIVCGSAWSECRKHPLASEEPGVADAAACCMQLDLQAKQITHVAHPRATPDPTVEVRGESICRGATCKPLHEKLAAAISDLRARATADDGLELSATENLEAVVVHLSRTRGIGAELWSPAKDAPVKLHRPGSSRVGAPSPDLTAVGDVVVVDWYDCAGPCHEARIIDAHGKQVGALIQGYTTVVRVNDELFAITSDTAGVFEKSPPDAFQLFELRTGKARGKIPLAPDAVGATVKLDSDHFAVLTSESDTRVVDVLVAKPNRPKVVADMTLPACP